MKRIVFIGAGLSSGGAEHQATLLMNMLIEQGYNVTYASFGDVADHYSLSQKVNRIQLAPGKSTIKKVLAVEFFLLRVKADVAIAFSQRLSVLALFPFLFRPKVKVICGERNYTIGLPDKFEKILMRTGVYRRANYIVPNNYSQGKYLSKVMPSIKKKIHVITNYTDVSLFHPTPTPNNRIIRIGVFCRFEEQKNCHRFIEALHLLKEKKGGIFRVDWYGNHTFSSEGQVHYYKEGMRMIEEYQLEDILFIHDPTKEVHKLIPTFDVMCLPSLHEGFSNSISEYICCARPVICSDVSDNSVMVHDGENGFLFNPQDVESIVRAFEKYISITEEERAAMGRRSREIAETLFDKEKFIKEYISIIEA